MKWKFLEVLLLRLYIWLHPLKRKVSLNRPFAPKIANRGLKWPSIPCPRIHVPCPAFILDAPLIGCRKMISTAMNECSSLDKSEGQKSIMIYHHNILGALLHYPSSISSKSLFDSCLFLWVPTFCGPPIWAPNMAYLSRSYGLHYGTPNSRVTDTAWQLGQ